MARIQGVPKEKASLATRFAYWLCRRRVGRIVEPLMIVANHPWVARGYGAFEVSLGKARRVDERLKALAEIKAATLIGCPF